jgi:hypothetical protein
MLVLYCHCDDSALPQQHTVTAIHVQAHLVLLLTCLLLYSDGVDYVILFVLPYAQCVASAMPLRHVT